MTNCQTCHAPLELDDYDLCLACDAKDSLVLALEILSDKSSSRTMKKFARDLIAYAKRHGVEAIA